jgi:hypothetical protein
MVFNYSQIEATSNPTTPATATNDSVAFSCVQFGFGHFFGPLNQTFKHY